MKHPRTAWSISVSFGFWALLATAGCDEEGGAGGTGGQAAATGGRVGTSTGSGGVPGSGGIAVGGQPGAGGMAGASGASGNVSDASSLDSVGETGDALSTADGAAQKSWTCPAGPFEAPKAATRTAVCGGISKYGWNEGPTWIAKENAFFYSNFVVLAAGPGDMIKFTPATGQCETFIVGNGCNGLAVAPDGNILAACHTPRAVLKYDTATKQSTVVVDKHMNQPLDSVNDLVVHSNGTIYFTNHTAELGGRPAGVGQALFRIDPAGMLILVAKGGVNGIALSPDEKRLYVVGMGVWDLDEKGLPSNRRGFVLGGDGIAMDCAGNVYDQSGTIRNPEGQQVGTFPGGTNMAFGGVDGKTLLVVRNKEAFTVQMNIPGLP